ncbi:MAG TPA: hypothetical protein PLQ29_06120 [Spirochaetales bacterium]|nr:hypothetical protein [Spirochaetales bacterium]
MTLVVSRKPILAWGLAIVVFPLANALLSLAARDALPLFFDSILTAVAAAVLGPWHGLATAILTNGWSEALDGFPGVHLPFAVCGIATALIVRAFVASGKYRGALPVSLCVGAVTLANALLGALIAAFVYGGGTRMNLDNIVAGFALFTDSVLTAAFLGRLPINLVDKTLAVAPALYLAIVKAAAAAAGQDER